MSVEMGAADDLGGIRYELPVSYRGLLGDVPGALVGVQAFDGSIAAPFAALRERALAANIAAMQQWCTAHDVELAPHGKTTLSPDLFARQLDAGAWGITVASPAQARVALAAGARRVLIANEVTDPAGIRWLGAALADDLDLGLWCYVDSTAGVRLLDRTLRGILPVGTRLDVLLEVGVVGGRTGVRDVDDAVAVAQAVQESSWLRLAGVAGYEGVPASAGAEPVAAVEAFCTRIREVAEALMGDDLVHADEEHPLLLSAGGSAYFDTVAVQLTEAANEIGLPATVVLRSGAYISHDEGLYARKTPASRGGDGPPLEPAFEVWATVLSRPEPTRAIVGVGRRDVPFDADLPLPRWRRRVDGGTRDLHATAVELNDQHCFLDLAAEEKLDVGDWVGFGISHPCTAFDKWNLVLLLDENDQVLQELPTRF